MFAEKYLEQYQEGPSFGPEARERQQHYISYDFKGGLNTDAALDHIGSTELRQADNVVLTERGCIGKRKGVKEFDILPSGFQIKQMIRWPLDGSKFFFVAISGGTPRLFLHRTNNYTELQNINRDHVGYFYSGDKMYFLDGVNLYEYDDETETVSVVENPVPEIPGDFSIEAVDWSEMEEPEWALYGTFECFMVYENVEGARKKSQIVTVEIGYKWWEFWEQPKVIRWFAPAIGDGEEYKVHFYRTKEGGEDTGAPSASTGFYHVHTATIPAEGLVSHFGVVFYDNRENEHLGKEYVEAAEYDLETVKRCKYAVRHPKSYRVFYSGDPENPSALYYSEPNLPEYLQETSVIFPPTGEGEVTGLKVFMDAILVFYSHGVWAWKGIDPKTDASWEKLPTSEGTMAERTIQLTSDSLTMFGHGGIYAMAPNIIGQTFRMEAGDSVITNIARNKVTNELKRITNPEGTIGVWDGKNQRYMLAYSDDSSEQNNNILVFDWNSGAFTRFTGINADAFMYNPDGSLFVASGNKIGLMNEGDHVADWGKVFKFRIRTKRFVLNAPFHNKKIDRVYIALQNPQEPGYGIYVYMIIDDTLAEEKYIKIEPGPSSLIARINTHAIGARFQIVIDDGEEKPSGIPEEFEGAVTISGGGGITIYDGEAVDVTEGVVISGGGGITIYDGELFNVIGQVAISGGGGIEIQDGEALDVIEGVAISGGGSIKVWDDVHEPEEDESTRDVVISGGGSIEITGGGFGETTEGISISGGGSVEITDGAAFDIITGVAISGGGSVELTHGSAHIPEAGAVVISGGGSIEIESN